MINHALGQSLRDRGASMWQDYYEFEGHFHLLRDYIMPRRGRLQKGEKTDFINRKVIDATAREALRTFEAGMMAGVTSPSRPWIKFGTLEEETDQAGKEWLATASKRFFAVARASNTYGMFSSAWRDLGLYGTHASIGLDDFEDVIRWQSLPMGEYAIAENDRFVVDSLHRKFRRTVDQVVRKYGYENCSDSVKTAYDRGDLSMKVDLEQAIEPRRDRNPLSKFSVNMPILSAVWETSEVHGKFLSLSGFKRNRLVTPRWDLEAPNVWGYSPAMDAFGDAAQLQQAQVEKALAIQKSHNPPLVGPAELRGTHAKNYPGGISYLSGMDLTKGGLRPIYEVKPDINGLMMDMAETRERIRTAFYADLFQMFTALDRRQITAEEIIRRYEEKVLLLGPALDRANKELLDPTVDIIMERMIEADLLPPAPDSLRGQTLKVEYISILAQAQRAAGIQPMERAIGFIGTLGQIKPGVIDLLDEDDMAREFWDLAGVPPETMRSAEDVAEVRKQRAEQEQAAAMMENALPMANAAKLISEASERGNVV